MNKSLKYSMFIVLLIVLILFFLHQSKTKTSLINEIPLLEQSIEFTDNTIPKKTLKPYKTPEEKDVRNSDENKLTHDDGDDEISYLSAYRDLLSFRKCMMTYYNSQNGVDLISNYIDNYFSYSDTQTKPNKIQIQYYHTYIDNCYSLLLSMDEKIDKAGSRLTKRFKNIEPETNDEIALSEALEIDKKIKEIFFQIYHEKNGKNTLSDDQKQANLKKRIAIIKKMGSIRKRNKGNMTVEDNLLIKELMNEIIKLNAVEGHEANVEELAYLEKELIKNMNELKVFFKNNQTPDVFLIFAEHLLNERMGKFFFTEDINNKLGIYDTEYINNLNKLIVPFIACSLEYPCGSESNLSIEHCIKPLGSKPLACGKNIIDYYLDDLVSPNQMTDFNNYFNYIMDNHAQI